MHPNEHSFGYLESLAIAFMNEDGSIGGKVSQYELVFVCAQLACAVEGRWQVSLREREVVV